jgi:hypothetical protein
LSVSLLFSDVSADSLNTELAAEKRLSVVGGSVGVDDGPDTVVGSIALTVTDVGTPGGWCGGRRAGSVMDDVDCGMGGGG